MGGDLHLGPRRSGTRTATRKRTERPGASVTSGTPRNRSAGHSTSSAAVRSAVAARSQTRAGWAAPVRLVRVRVTRMIRVPSCCSTGMAMSTSHR